MQVFTRCANYYKWSRCCNRLPGSWCKLIWYHSTARKEKHSNQTNTSNQQKHTETRQSKTKTPQEPKHHEVEWHIQKQRWNVMTRQLMCPVLSRSSLKQQLKAKHLKDDRGVPSKKVAVPKPRIPPARIPEIASRSRAGITSTMLIDRLDMPSCVKRYEGEPKVKRRWDIQSEKKTAATSTGLSESSHVCFGDHHSHTQSPECWRSVPVRSFSLPTLMAVVKFSVPHTEDKWVRCHRRVLL